MKMLLKTYLETYFVDKPAFAELAGVSMERLNALIENGSVSKPSYVCDGASLHSAAFGAIDSPERIFGEYFRPECARWVRIADRAAAGAEKSEVEGLLVDELSAALKASEDLVPAGGGSTFSRVKAYLPSFFDGTFGVCVANPASGGGIVEKEVLQEKLSALTENGANPFPEGLHAAELLQLIDDYAKAAMPFSPVEYPRSSRKRLVDDLRPRVESGTRR